MGILGNWIGDGSAQPFYARKRFRVAKEVASATAKVCGLGQFVFWLNGRKVDDHELDPGWTDYRKLIEYVAFDIKDYLVVGENTLGAEVGNGWFLKNDEHYTFHFPRSMPPNPNPYRPFGRSLVLALELRITYADGTEDTIRADGSFRVSRHPVVQSNVYGSETMDGRLRQSGWSEAGFDDRGWQPAKVLPAAEEPAGVLVEQAHPPVKVIHSYPARYLHTVNGRDIYDLGQNMSGMLQFEARGKAGDVIRVYPAEKLGADGDVDQAAKNWTTVDSVLTYITGSDDTWERFRMKFTYFAGKVVAVEKSSRDAQVRGITGEAITSAWKTDGSFECDDVRYDQIYRMVERTVEANMVSVHTDCPTIERFAWQEPNHLMGAAIMYMKDGRKLWEMFLMDMRTAQHTAGDYFCDGKGGRLYPGDGLVPAQCPCYSPNVMPVPGLGDFYDTVPWGSSCILAVRWHYLFYGDLRVVEENYPCGMRYLRHLKTKVDDDGFLGHGLGGWGNPEHALARENVETAFLYADAVTLAWFAELLGREGDRQERIPDIVGCLRRALEEKGAFVSGEVGLPYIIQTAAEHRMNDLIAAFITREEEHPSYYAFVKEGMTTLGEYWETNPRSHCHDMTGYIIEWYYNGIAGIRIGAPGFSKVQIRPYLPESMDWFRCSYDSVNGPIQVAVSRRGGTSAWRCRCRRGSSARSTRRSWSSAGRSPFWKDGREGSGATRT